MNKDQILKIQWQKLFKKFNFSYTLLGLKSMEITFIKPYFQLYDEFAHDKFPKLKKIKIQWQKNHSRFNNPCTIYHDVFEKNTSCSIFSSILQVQEYVSKLKLMNL